MKIELQKSTFFNEEKTKNKLCDFIMKSKILTMSEQCLSFEKNFSKFQNRSFSTMVNSGSSANLVLLQSLINLKRLKIGDKVAVSALTWATNIMPVMQLGLIPILVDCEISNLNCSFDNFFEIHQFEKDIKCFFITNVLGFCADIDRIQEYCNINKIILIEDNCESLGSVYKKKLLGNFGIASTFSFFVGHHMSTIEGGMICTDDEELSNQLIMCRAHGWDRNLTKELQINLREKFDIDDFYSRYTFYDLGYNLRPTEINGFLGNLQIEYLSFIVKKRESLFTKFNALLQKSDRIVNIDVSYMDIVSSFAIPIICKTKKDAAYFKKSFSKLGFEIRPMIAGNIGRQPFIKKSDIKISKMTNADLIHTNGFYFGNHPDISAEEESYIENSIKELM